MTIRLLSAVAALSLACTLTPHALAQSSTPSAQPADPTLKGPSVPDRQVSPRTTTAAGFGPDSIEKKKAGGKRPTPPPSMTQFMSALGVLQTSTYPLTSEQNGKIQSISTEFDTATRSYMDKNKAEIDTLRNQLSPTDRAMLDNQLARGGQIKLSKAGFGGKKRVAKQNGPRGSNPSTTSTPETTPSATASNADAAGARTRLVEIYANRPKAEDAQAKILGVLTGDQLALVDARLSQVEPSQHEQGAHKRVRPARTRPAK